MPDKESHVNGCVERIEKQFHVYVLAQFAAANAATKRGVCFQSPRKQEAFPESSDQISIALSSAKYGGTDSPPPPAKNFSHFPPLPPLSRPPGTGIRKL